jgi:hypothetical protein
MRVKGTRHWITLFYWEKEAALFDFVRMRRDHPGRIVTDASGLRRYRVMEAGNIVRIREPEHAQAA